jgi:hypothetical protein
MEYSINNFLTESECLTVINYFENNGVEFSYTNDTKAWDCKRIAKDDFSFWIIKKFTDLYSEGKIKLWFPYENFSLKDFNLSVTKYYDGRFLNLHLDKFSQLTTTVLLSENFFDGRFVLSDSEKLIHGASQAVPLLGSVPNSNFKEGKKLHLEIGQCISFDGTKTYHGVMPVTEGVRYALNIWMTDTETEFITPAKKSLF